MVAHFDGGRLAGGRGGREVAIGWNLLGLLDFTIAVGIGIRALFSCCRVRDQALQCALPLSAVGCPCRVIVLSAVGVSRRIMASETLAS